MPILESKLFLLCCMLAGSVLSAAAASGSPGITTDDRVLMICTAAALGGGFISISVFPPTTPGIKPYARRITVSTLTGVFFTPAAFDYYTWPLHASYLMIVSATVAVLAWSVLQFLIPWAVDKAQSFFGPKKEETK